MTRIKKIFLFLVIPLFFIVTGNFSIKVFAQSPDARVEELSNEIEQYQKEIDRLKSQAATLSNQIAQYDAQISLTSLKIKETKEKILLLGGRIDQLEVSLDTLSSAFASRAVYTYKMARINQPLLLLITAPDLSDAVSSFHYLQRIQEADRDLLVRLENAQVAYRDQKVDQENLQGSLEDQERMLAAQKSAKAKLLTDTRSDEKRYQGLLAAARSEYEAIQAIIAGKGQEQEMGKVSQGQKIASIIQGPSCNSSGEHLHFMVTQGGNTQNPFNYLKAGIDYENCSSSSCGASDADTFNPSGSWDWPVNPKIKFFQGYGSTWAIRNSWVGRIYQFHNGIDIESESSADVKAVKAGTLFRGGYTGYNGCSLRYVKVRHDEGGLETYYLHINY